MDEMAILAEEAKAMLRSHYVSIPKRAVRWSWGLALLALAICGVLAAFAYWQEQRLRSITCRQKMQRHTVPKSPAVTSMTGKRRCVVYW